MPNDDGLAVGEKGSVGTLLIAGGSVVDEKWVGVGDEAMVEVDGADGKAAGIECVVLPDEVSAGGAGDELG